jgi:hypothetical protein
MNDAFSAPSALNAFIHRTSAPGGQAIRTW